MLRSKTTTVEPTQDSEWATDGRPTLVGGMGAWSAAGVSTVSGAR